SGRRAPDAAGHPASPGRESPGAAVVRQRPLRARVRQPARAHGGALEAGAGARGACGAKLSERNVFDVEVGAVKPDSSTRDEFSVAVAGAGWYGCHIASALKSQGVKGLVFEKNDDLFNEASGNNPYRLHLGLHYARSAATRHQSRDGYHRFVERYPRLSRPVADNIYLVPRFESLIDFETYFSIMLASGIAIDRVPLDTMPFLNAAAFEGAIRCDERVILTSKAREHFRAKLDGVVRLGAPIETFARSTSGVQVNGQSFDLLIDATWGALQPAKDVFFEPTLLLYYRYRGNVPFP